MSMSVPNPAAVAKARENRITTERIMQSAPRLAFTSVSGEPAKTVHKPKTEAQRARAERKRAAQQARRAAQGA